MMDQTYQDKKEDKQTQNQDQSHQRENESFQLPSYSYPLPPGIDSEQQSLILYQDSSQDNQAQHNIQQNGGIQQEIDQIQNQVTHYQSSDISISYPLPPSLEFNTNDQINTNVNQQQEQDQEYHYQNVIHQFPIPLISFDNLENNGDYHNQSTENDIPNPLPPSSIQYQSFNPILTQSVNTVTKSQCNPLTQSINPIIQSQNNPFTQSINHLFQSQQNPFSSSSSYPLPPEIQPSHMLIISQQISQFEKEIQNNSKQQNEIQQLTNQSSHITKFPSYEQSQYIPSNYYYSKQLFIKNLNINTTREEIRQFFISVGQIERIILQKDEQGNSKGFGYITMKDEISAQKALTLLNGKELGGNNILISYSNQQDNQKPIFPTNINALNKSEPIINLTLNREISPTYQQSSQQQNNNSSQIIIPNSALPFQSNNIRQSTTNINQPIDSSIFNNIKSPDKQSFQNKLFIPSKQLFIKNLNINTTREEIRQFFISVGQIERIILQKDEQGNSKGFGYITMKDEISAQKALTLLNGKELGGNNILISYSNQQDNQKPIFPTNINALNKSEPIINLTLNREISPTYQQSSQQQNNNSSQIIPLQLTHKSKNNKKRRKHSPSIKSSQSQNSTISNLPMTSQSSQMDYNDIPNLPEYNLSIQNINFETTEQELCQFFEQVGHVESVKYPKDKKGRNMGFGFVTMKNRNEVIRALNELNNQIFNDRIIRVELGKQQVNQLNESLLQTIPPKISLQNHINNQSTYNRYIPQESNIPSSTYIYISNIPPTISEKEIRGAFWQYDVQEIKILRTKLGEPTGICQIKFESEKVQQQILQMKDIFIGGQKIVISKTLQSL